MRDWYYGQEFDTTIACDTSKIDSNSNNRDKSNEANRKNKDNSAKIDNPGSTFTYEEVQTLLKYTYEVAYESGRNDAAKKMQDYLCSMIDSIVSDTPANDAKEM